jgi:predicted dehydrogenase
MSRNEKVVKLGVIGLGQQRNGYFEPYSSEDGRPWRSRNIGVCDLYEDRVKSAVDKVREKTGKEPVKSTDYNDILKYKRHRRSSGYDCVGISIDIATAAMKKGIKVGMEVGGAYSIDDCFKLVKTYEETGIHCMMLENCCYGRKELMVLNMVKQGVLGDIVHCSGGYMHDLREEISDGDINRHIPTEKLPHTQLRELHHA